MEIEEILKSFHKVKTRYKFDYNLKKEQVDVLSNILRKKSVFAVLPTGFGKSDTFILPPLLLDEISPQNKPHVSLVVSPLRSLLMNQVSNLRQKGVKACAVLQYKEMSQEDIDGVSNGEFSIVFISPETLLSQPWRKMLKKANYKKRLCLVACDEAHCISQWGSDFRPQYRNVSVLRSLCSNRPCLMLTATCTEKIKADVLECLLLENEDVVTIAVVPDRPNIFLNYKSKPGMTYEDEIGWLIDVLIEKGTNTPKTIIYCRSINDAASIWQHIVCKLGEKAWDGERVAEKRIVEMYHAAVSKGSEERVVTEFPKPDGIVRCLVSTIAFGMGVQITDIEIVAHWGASKTVLSYWQEIGRSGRDGRPASAHLYAYLRSLDKRRTEEDMLSLCNTVKDGEFCLRVKLLEKLTVAGMDLDQLRILDSRTPCDRDCNVCSCSFCACCTFCREKCSCYKAPLMEVD